MLTTEEEGIGVLSGAWLGGERGVLLMQRSASAFRQLRHFCLATSQAQTSERAELGESTR